MASQQRSKVQPSASASFCISASVMVGRCRPCMIALALAALHPSARPILMLVKPGWAVFKSWRFFMLFQLSFSDAQRQQRADNGAGKSGRRKAEPEQRFKTHGPLLLKSHCQKARSLLGVFTRGQSRRIARFPCGTRKATVPVSRSSARRSVEYR